MDLLLSSCHKGFLVLVVVVAPYVNDIFVSSKRLRPGDILILSRGFLLRNLSLVEEGVIKLSAS